MGKDTTIIDGLIEFRKSVSKEIKVDQLLFFGSRATGKYKRDSDIDLLIVSNSFKNIKPFKRAIKLYSKTQKTPDFSHGDEWVRSFCSLGFWYHKNS